MKEEGFVSRGFIPSLNVIHKRELNDLLYDENENEVEDFFKEINSRNSLRLHDFRFTLVGKKVLKC